jgi:hypothetical protein
MKISTLDLRASDDFIRSELKKHPGTTIAEIQASVKKKFNRGTSPERIAKIRKAVTFKGAPDDLQDALKVFAAKMKTSTYHAVAFVKVGKKIRISWDREKTVVERNNLSV